MSSLSTADTPIVASGARNPLMILFSPISFYERLRAERTPSFWLPLLLIAIASWSFTALSGTMIGFDQLAANEMASRGMTAADPSISGTIAAVIMLSWPVNFTILTLLSAVVLYAVFSMALGYDITLRQVIAVSFFACVPRLFRYVLSIIPLVADSSAPDRFLPSNPLPTNPAYFLGDAGLSHGVMAALASLDLFTLWSLVLIALGIKIIGRRPFAPTAGVVGLCWVVFLLVKMLMQ